eukprot:7228009-Lingulodinium_polyedra.AAC.1
MVPAVEPHVDVPPVDYLDTVVQVPVQEPVHVPKLTKAQTPVEVPQVPATLAQAAAAGISREECIAAEEQLLPDDGWLVR